MNSEKRAHMRLPLEIEVELHCPGCPVRVLRTEDMSTGGLLLVLEPPEGGEVPPLGTQVVVRVVGTLGDGDTPPMVEALVVRHVDNGFAVAFTETLTEESGHSQ